MPNSFSHAVDAIEAFVWGQITSLKLTASAEEISALYKAISTKRVRARNMPSFVEEKAPELFQALTGSEELMQAINHLCKFAGVDANYFTREAKAILFHTVLSGRMKDQVRSIYIESLFQQNSVNYNISPQQISALACTVSVSPQEKYQLAKELFNGDNLPRPAIPHQISAALAQHGAFAIMPNAVKTPPIEHLPALSDKPVSPQSRR